MAYALVDFEDIYSAVLEELKIPSTDGTTLARIKRDINMIYLNEVIPFKPRAWWWLQKKEDVITYEKYDTGTLSVTEDSTTITFSSAPSISLAGYYVKLTGYPEVVKITSHTAATTTATLESAWVLATASAQDYKAWKDYIALDSDTKEVIQVTHDRMASPLAALTNVKFSEFRARYPETEGFPQYYNTGDFDSDGNRTISWYPSCWDTKVTLHINSIQEASALNLDADEPLMPVEDRIVLFYGACSRAWARERNEGEAVKNWNLFTMKLKAMAAKSGDAPQVTEMRVDSDYTINKRYRRFNRRGYGRRWESSD